MISDKKTLYKPKPFALYVNGVLDSTYPSHSAAKKAMHFKKKNSFENQDDDTFQLREYYQHINLTKVFYVAYFSNRIICTEKITLPIGLKPNPDTFAKLINDGLNHYNGYNCYPQDIISWSLIDDFD